jgi:hypothetical protein
MNARNGEGQRDPRQAETRGWGGRGLGRLTDKVLVVQTRSGAHNGYDGHGDGGNGESGRVHLAHGARAVVQLLPRGEVHLWLDAEHVVVLQRRSRTARGAGRLPHAATHTAHRLLGQHCADRIPLLSLRTRAWCGRPVEADARAVHDPVSRLQARIEFEREACRSSKCRRWTERVGEGSYAGGACVRTSRLRS